MEEPIKLDLGAGDPADGERSPEGYLKQDVDGSIPGIDIVCDITDLAQFVKPESCRAIRASHVIEHFPTKQIPELFVMIKGLLEPLGTFEVIVPNFAWHAELTLAGEDEKAVYYAFGGQLDEWDFHKTGFTPRILRKRFEEAGFIVILVEGVDSIRMIGEKDE